MSRSKLASIALVIAGVVGFIGVFLPHFKFAGAPVSTSYWDLHLVLSIGRAEGLQPLFVLGLFAATFIIGVLATFGTTRRSHGRSATVFGIALFFFEGVRDGLLGLSDAPSRIGGKMMFVAALVTLLAGVVTLSRRTLTRAQRDGLYCRLSSRASSR